MKTAASDLITKNLADALASILADMDANKFPSDGIFAGINALNAYREQMEKSK